MSSTVALGTVPIHSPVKGFEFQSDSNNIELKKFYNEQPLTKENYSYPGQLQKLIGNDIKVYNHSKSGYGNERMYRLAYDVLNNKTTNKEKLLLLEFSHIGRKEYYSKSINDFSEKCCLSREAYSFKITFPLSAVYISLKTFNPFTSVITNETFLPFLVIYSTSL